MRLKKTLIPLIAVLLLVLSACAVAPVSPPEGEQPAVATSTLVASDTAAPPAATLTATPPPPTPTPEPTETPAEAGTLRIAYAIPGENVYLWEAGQLAGVQVGEAGQIGLMRISGDGQLLAYSRLIDFFRAELWVVDLANGQARLLLGQEDFMAYNREAFGLLPFQLEWVPGTHTLAFTLSEVLEGPGAIPYNDLHYLDVDSGELVTIFERDQGGQFTYSPDGRMMAITTPSSVGLANADGSEIRRDLLTFELVLTYSEYQFYPRPVWSGDGSQFLVAIPPADSLSPDAPSTVIWRIPVEGAAERVIEFSPAPLFGFMGPDFISADHGLFAYERELGEPQENRRELVIANLDGSAEMVYDSGPLVFNGWSPDGQRFTYTRFGEESLTLLGQIGESPARLGNAGFAQDVRWLDPNRLLFIEFGEDAVWKLRALELGSASVVLAESALLPPVFDFAPEP